MPMGEKYGGDRQSSLSIDAGLSSGGWETDRSNSEPPEPLCCRRNLSASALNSSSSGLRTSNDAERLTRGSWRVLAGVRQVASWKLWDELENLLEDRDRGRQREKC